MWMSEGLLSRLMAEPLGLYLLGSEGGEEGSHPGAA